MDRDAAPKAKPAFVAIPSAAHPDPSASVLLLNQLIEFARKGRRVFDVPSCDGIASLNVDHDHQVGGRVELRMKIDQIREHIACLVRSRQRIGSGFRPRAGYADRTSTRLSYSHYCAPRMPP